ncbi:hypothetical protein DEU56DRAFT_740592, partial [Suillus clintonianus]|uniref:uncharacterized protein n=1 Tax=Suillus clintonianus TaxID=1904413 RepID=UPI001B86B023
VGDLQKGEKYLNMDYIVFSALAKLPRLTNVNLSYNIACQWHKKLKDHIPGMPLKLQPGKQADPLSQISSASAQKKFNFFIPKFHLAAHIKACQTKFSFNWTPGVGRTDGEAPERGWANINRVATSTKEMGPGARREILDDFFGDSNWKKTTVLGLYQESDLGVSSLATWKAEIKSWETDHTNPNPFERRVDSESYLQLFD